MSMNKPAEKVIITSKKTGEFFISGGLDFNDITGLFQELCHNIDACTENNITLDFSAISQSNSAGLALLLNLLRHCAQTKKQIQFLHLPAKLISMAKISDMDVLFNDAE